MDPIRFDALLRSFAVSPSRRGLLAVIARGLLPAAAAASLTGETDAKKRKKGKKKKKRPAKPCVPDCGGKACGAGDGCGGTCTAGSCPGVQVCVNGGCQDECPTTRCGNDCVDLQTSNQHCGVCGNGCLGALTCIGGQCGCLSTTQCGNQCVDVQTDTDHCGSCGNLCDPGETCTGGQCRSSGCGSGQRDCGNGLCIPDDDEHCCNLADCGGQFSDLFCNATTHRCECEIAGRGRCTGQNRFSCAPCCPGSNFTIGDRCAGANDERVCVDQTFAGCRCPDAMPNICSAFNQTKCTVDQNRDPRVCGRFCEECAPGGICCGGLCHYGCGHGTGGSCASGPCNPDCSPCQQGSTCCNFGGGPACYEGMGTICFRP